MTTNRTTDRPSVHVFPAANDPEHALRAGTCWCQPVLDYTDPVTGAQLWVHRPTLDSPRYESPPLEEPPRDR